VTHRCPYPTIRFVAWDSRLPAQIFVPDPSLRGRYILTDRCVALVSCSLCHAIPGEPCKSRSRYHAATHCVRRDAVKWRTRGGLDVPDILEPIEDDYSWEAFCT
jgi:hypothetical protein